MIKSSLFNSNRALLFRKLGVGLSGLCAIHCILLPVVLIFLPLSKSYLRANIFIEILIYTSVALVGGFFLRQDFLKHRNKVPLTLFVAGLLLLIIAHAIHIYIYNIIALCIGGLLLAISQLLNIKLHRAICKA